MATDYKARGAVIQLLKAVIHLQEALTQLALREQNAERQNELMEHIKTIDADVYKTFDALEAPDE